MVKYYMSAIILILSGTGHLYPDEGGNVNQTDNLDHPESQIVIDSKSLRKKVLEMTYHSDDLAYLRCPQNGTREEWILAMGFPINPLEEEVWIYVRKEKFPTRPALKSWKDVNAINAEDRVGLMLVIFENGKAIHNVYCKVLSEDVYSTVREVYELNSPEYDKTSVIPKAYQSE